ncbi:ribonucleoside-diphosphate reductase, adenosylcobalamin-dependent [candidate division WWE3 bacterium CG08_land_8_20_14_0_20_40_13]|uniref:Vitamin B12-dependent ribonucleotide reductase n=1 Tax=candidate division WWE3 bacterium CG08_land_8_20_14_0_20_40_13 TaxID=1975084 RepID=A0A2H0XCY6_UNCKA|nr:MAG: ribonucleoside-diphosphate reductase, adenosylcobalamin-dependent [candidate division WWE3 bacterium CG08_land_8_20_14_0_20_40_13]
MRKSLPKFLMVKEVKEIDIKGNALDIFMRRYALKGEDGKPKETLEEAFWRVASYVADAEKSPSLKNHYAKLFYNLMASKRFIPNTPTWSGSKTKLGQLAACFVLPIEDDMGRDNAGIFNTLRDAALIQQSGGGVGFSFSRLRPKGDIVKSSNGVASGPVSFMEIYDAAFGRIAQGGTRRGANMAVLRVDHPDIFEFISCKAKEGRISNFNISVGISDDFMKAVEEDRPLNLINPHSGAVAKTINARELFDEIIKYSHHNGEPGMLFLDRANRDNPVPHQYVLEATNPCGEQWLGPYENCCLGHINLSVAVSDDGRIDWEALRESVVLGTRFLDDVVSKNAYISEVPELKEAAHKNRRIGLGFMGLADAMYKMGIRYGSEKSLDFTSQITEFIRFYSMKTSISLAVEKGAFPGIKGSIYDPKNLKWKIPTSLKEHQLDFERPNLDWEQISLDLKSCGIRNSTQLTVAPTGITSTVFDVEGYGCEPVFALAYFRNVYQSAGGQENLRLAYVSPSFKRALDDSGIPEEQKEAIIQEALNKGTIQHVTNIPERLKDIFVVSQDISAEEHVLLQATIQKFVDNSISKTCNFPEGATEEDVKKAYITAWRLGCKGLTVYVTGSRNEVVLETKETTDKKNKQEELPISVEEDIKRPRPAVVVGRTHEILTPFGKAFITVNRNSETSKKPFEVFINVGKAGSDTAALAEALGRLISGWLRSTKNPDKALEEISDQLQGIGGSQSIGFGIHRVTSVPDAIAKVLAREMELTSKMEEHAENLIEAHKEDLVDAERPVGVFKNASVCPSCGNMTLVETEGCIKCFSCQYSRC